MHHLLSCIRLSVKVEFQQPHKEPLSIFLEAHESDTIDILQTQVREYLSAHTTPLASIGLSFILESSLHWPQIFIIILSSSHLYHRFLPLFIIVGSL